MKPLHSLAAVIGLLAVPASLLAIPYPTPGTENLTTYTFTATATGSITAYFYGQSASYGSDIGLIVNDISTGTYGLQNHISNYGDSFNMGSVTAGDVIEFELQVSTSNGSGPPPLSYSLYSNAAKNSDGKNHIYSEAFPGDGTIPAGTYVAFEDILGLGDKDYDDHQFVFTDIGVTTNTTPDGGSTLALAGLSLAALGAIRRKLA